MKKILFLTNRFMNIYLDIIHEMQIQGYDVTYIEDQAMPDDPYLIRNKDHTESEYEYREQYFNDYWKSKIDNDVSKWSFDCLFVIEGFSVSSYLIEKLVEYNPNIKKILYIYDRTFGNYRFDLLFQYFDGIYTFDIFDSKYYNINHLPIYWVPCENDGKTKYLIFGFATYQGNRYNIFRKIKKMVATMEKSSFIKVYVQPYREGVFKSLFRKIMGKNLFLKLDKDLVSDKTLLPDEFRKMISNSDIILDTHNDFQDGLTARFMWALGAGKKIITTNKSVVHYKFYDPNIICIIDNNVDVPSSFLLKANKIKTDINTDIQKYRIDNWLSRMLNA